MSQGPAEYLETSKVFRTCFMSLVNDGRLIYDVETNPHNQEAW